MLNADDMYRNTCVMFSHLMTFLLRPNAWMSEKIEAKLARSLPPGFDPMRTMGLPIRGSDKCIGHGVCPYLHPPSSIAPATTHAPVCPAPTSALHGSEVPIAVLPG
jgi:hypothetical protein